MSLVVPVSCDTAHPVFMSLVVQVVLFSLLVSVCCDTGQAFMFLEVLVCCDTAKTLVFLLLVSVCCNTSTARAKATEDRPCMHVHLISSDLVQVHVPSRQLHSSADTRLLRLPPAHLKRSSGRRAFFYQAPAITLEKIYPILSPKLFFVLHRFS